MRSKKIRYYLDYWQFIYPLSITQKSHAKTTLAYQTRHACHQRFHRLGNRRRIDESIKDPRVVRVADAKHDGKPLAVPPTWPYAVTLSRPHQKTLVILANTP